MSPAQGTMRESAAQVLIAAGGTGGHVYPGLAVADVLRARGVGVAWVGTRTGLEYDRVPRAGFELYSLRVSGLRGTGLGRWLRAPFVVAGAVVEAVRIVRRLRPRLVLGMGGYVSGPAGLAAKLCRVPLVIHEQNAVPGLTNRILARLATRVLEAFPGSFPPGRHAAHCGNPVRTEIASLAPPDQRLAERDGPLRLLVLGGSQGALALNQVLPPAMARTCEVVPVEVWHQTGPRHLDRAVASYREAGLVARAEGFIEDMARAYGWADLVLCRAGAMTVSELSAAGVGAILVPFPHAVDDHQTANARYLEAAGAARIVAQVDLEPARLESILVELATTRSKLLDMARAARRLARPDAAAAVADACLEVAHA